MNHSRRFIQIIPLFFALLMALFSCQVTREEVIQPELPVLKDTLLHEISTPPIDAERGEEPGLTDDYSDDDSAGADEIKPGLRGPAGTTEMAAVRMEKMTDSRVASYREGGAPVSMLPDAMVDPGQLTAGEWNDLQNWDAWRDLLKDTDYNDMQPYWGIYPRTRFTAFVTNTYELPLVDVELELLDKEGNVLWKAKTDNSGKAELWSGLFESQRQFSPVDIRINHRASKDLIKDVKSIEEGVNHLVIDVECRFPKYADVLFVVDATGSMGDEIRYLQSELQDVISRIEHANRSLTLRTGAIFYRDHGDEYLTRNQGLTSDHNQTMLFLSEQRANGGGDYPEAVDAALNEALAQDWSEQAVARIIFLLLDAPPPHKTYEMDRINQQIRDAAAEGIKIIPITASGINRPTEFLMKFMAIATNGTYVFITDDSGIGGSHLDPVVKDYKVEKLNDLMMRLVYNYTKPNGCDANDLGHEDVRIYPNPTSNYVNINSEDDLLSIEILTNSGMRVIQRDKLEKGIHKIDLNHLVDGVYTVICSSADGVFTQPLILING